MRALISQEVQPEASADMIVLMFAIVVLVDMLLSRLHLDDQVAVVSIDVGRVKDAAARLKTTTGLVPARLVKVVEIVAPSELKLV